MEIKSLAVIRSRKRKSIEVLIQTDDGWFVATDLADFESASVVKDFSDLIPCANECLPPILAA